jgi:hypothetical protein
LLVEVRSATKIESEGEKEGMKAQEAWFENDSKKVGNLSAERQDKATSTCFLF